MFSNDPVPPPVADFSGNRLVGHLMNGDFETGNFNGWSSSSGASIYKKTGTTTNVYNGTYSAKIVVPIGGSEWIAQEMNFTDVETISFYKKALGAIGVYPYVEVKVDSDVVANSTVPFKSGGYISIETINVSQYEGTHTLRFNVVSNSTSQGLTIYLDTFGDYIQGTTGPAPLTIQFKDTSTKMEDTAHTSWAWDFTNDGTTDKTLQNPVDIETKTSYIIVGTPPAAEFIVNITSGIAPLTVKFNDASTGSGISTWKWDFDNNGIIDSTEQNPEHTYPTAGTYSVNLTVTNYVGSDCEVKTDYITVSAAPVADFTALPLSGIAPVTVQFTDTSTNSPTSWRWAYMNASVGWTQFSTAQNPEYTFPAGTYDINLTATNSAALY